jgi:hypothetical protein
LDRGIPRPYGCSMIQRNGEIDPSHDNCLP